MSDKQLPKPTPETHNDKLLIGLLVGGALGFLIFWSLDKIAVHAETLFIILVAVVLLMALLLVLVTWFRKRIIRKFFGKDIAFETVITDTQETLELFSDNVAKNLPIEAEKKEQIRVFAPKLINYILWSNFRNWGLRIFTSFILGLGGLVTTILILNQNKLFENQNRLFQKQNLSFERQNKLVENQNKRIEQQTNLLEADRRSAQVFIMGEVLSDLNKELEDPKNTQRTLSNTLVGRIISLSRAMKPYRYLENDTLIKKPLSPERGQLLISLVESKIDSTFFVDRILANADFSYADLKGANLNKANLSSIDLSDAVLSDADLRDVNLTLADLSYGNFRYADLKGANFYKANLSGINLSNADLRNADLRIADLRNADLGYANLIFSGLRYVNLRDANLFLADLNSSDLSDADLSNANLNYTNLRGLDLTNIKSLDSVTIGRYDWLTYIKDSLKLKGSEDIYQEYRIDYVVHDDLIIPLETPTLIKKIKPIEPLKK